MIGTIYIVLIFPLKYISRLINNITIIVPEKKAFRQSDAIKRAE